ncbi:membrane protein [Desulforhabdus amnigena]|jgi:drug/metabolite transporter (DMT)-like permease|uniref:Membrane protein n=2 Tax=Desulforhabdus amnigena TaxID=40218 RepID=A0A9W6D0M3_9BACT|nr:membrane protein [Desulforhabdus amnigena]
MQGFEFMDQSASIPKRGYLYVALGALLWAISGSSAKFLFQQGVTPFDLAQARVTLASVLLFLWLLLHRPSLLRISYKDIAYFVVLGVAGMAMVHLTYFLAISKIKVAAAILLQYQAPVLIALYGVIVAKENLTRYTVLAILGAIAGCYLVVGAYNLDLLTLNREGVIYGLLSAMAFGGYSVYGERGMRRYDPWTVLFYALLIAAIFWNSVHPLWNAAPPPFASVLRSYSPVQWAWILYIVVLGTILPFGLYFQGINLIRSTRASITATLEPITAGVISYIFLRESLSSLQILGAILVIGAIVLLQLRQEYDDKTPALIRARSNTAKAA